MLVADWVLWEEDSETMLNAQKVYQEVHLWSRPLDWKVRKQDWAKEADKLRCRPFNTSPIPQGALELSDPTELSFTGQGFIALPP